MKTGGSAVLNEILLIGWVLTSVLRTGRYYSPCLPPVTAQCVLKSLGISITPITSDSSTTYYYYHRVPVKTYRHMEVSDMIQCTHLGRQ